MVVLTSPAQVLMPWAGKAKAVVSSFLGGQELGNALAAVLFGDADPGGRLPMTVARRASDYPASTRGQFPGVGLRQVYSERLRVGYRHFDATGVAPLFPFGHGLSYTTFSYRGLSVSGTTVRVTVRNTGPRAGVAVPQLYLGFPGERGAAAAAARVRQGTARAGEVGHGRLPPPGAGVPDLARREVGDGARRPHRACRGLLAGPAAARTIRR
nr:hypothetical protein GCM10020093_032360 [Planobispora longispora]